MKTKSIILGLLITASILPVAASTEGQKQKKAQQKIDCEGAQTQFEMTQCAHREFVKADAELNKFYNRFAAKLDEEKRAQLKEAELAWIKYRDATCDFEGAFYKGGTMRPMIQYACLARVTNDRTADLKLQLEIYEQ